MELKLFCFVFLKPYTLSTAPALHLSHSETGKLDFSSIHWSHLVNTALPIDAMFEAGRLPVVRHSTNATTCILRDTSPISNRFSFITKLAVSYNFFNFSSLSHPGLTGRVPWLKKSPPIDVKSKKQKTKNIMSSDFSITLMILLHCTDKCLGLSLDISRRRQMWSNVTL